MSQFTKRNFNIDEENKKDRLAYSQNMHNNYFERVLDHSLSLNIKKKNNLSLEKFKIRKCIRTNTNIIASGDSNRIYILDGEHHFLL